MITEQRLQKKMGECEICPNSGTVALTKNPANIWMCDKHWAEEQVVIKAQKDQLILQAQKTVTDSRAKDSEVAWKPDVFVSTATSITELKGAIQNDTAIPDDQKNYAVAKELTLRVELLQRAIFEATEKLEQLKSEKYVFIGNIQNLVATLSHEKQAEFKNFNVNAPSITSTKTVKPTKSPKTLSPKAPSKPKRSFTRIDLADIHEVAEKYGVPAHLVKMMCETQAGLSFEQAAQKLQSAL